MAVDMVLVLLVVVWRRGVWLSVVLLGLWLLVRLFLFKTLKMMSLIWFRIEFPTSLLKFSGFHLLVVSREFLRRISFNFKGV